jgi:hypothetical protein
LIAVRALVAGTTLAVALSGCDAVLGIEHLPRGTDAGDARPSPIVYANEACADCVDNGCAGAIEGCRADFACDALYRCVSSCGVGDPRCRADCEDAAPNVAHEERYRAVDACQRAACGPSCYGGGLLHMWNDACACADVACAAENLACVQSGIDRPGETVGACERRWACSRNAQNPDQGHECFFTSREGDQELQALRFCAQRSICSGCPMGGGNVLACSGTYAWSIPHTDKIEYAFLARNFVSTAPMAALTVKACGPLDLAECKAPHDTQQTNESGLVTLQVPAYPSGFVGCFEITGGAVNPTLVCNGYPLVRQENIRGVNLLTTDETILLGASLGIAPDATRGHVLVSVFDCVWTPIVGATVTASTADASSKTFYFRDRKLVDTPDGTGIDGIGALLNLPAGPVTITVNKGGRIIATFTTIARAGTLTNVVLPPQPISR